MSELDVSSSETTYRRIQPVLVVDDPKAPTGKRASSAAFNDDNDGSPMSVYLKSIVYGIGCDKSSVADGKEKGWGVAATPVQKFLDEEQRVKPAPVTNAKIPHICDRAHALVVGDKTSKKRRERLAKASPIVYIVP
jgi:hypothetical protein